MCLIGDVCLKSKKRCLFRLQIQFVVQIMFLLIVDFFFDNILFKVTGLWGDFTILFIHRWLSQKHISFYVLKHIFQKKMRVIIIKACVFSKSCFFLGFQKKLHCIIK